MIKLNLTLSGLEDTQRFARILASNSRISDVILLKGSLGAGKTACARFFLQSLDSSVGDIPSPTFTLVQTYDTPKGAVWHFDLYRIEDPEEIYELGMEEAISTGISLIEWPERFSYNNLHSYLLVEFSISGGSERNVTLSAKGPWEERLPLVESAFHDPS